MKKMQLFALEIDESLFYSESICYMNMPESWRNFINKERINGGYKLSFKLKPLGVKLKSIFPEIISILSDNNMLIHNQPWLVSTKPIPESYVRQLTLGWLADVKGCSISELPPEVRDADPDWVACNFDDIHGIIDHFQWIPGMAAIKFCEDPKFLDLGNELCEELKFHHIIFNGKNECISNPLQKSNRHDPFSYIIRLDLKTRGGDAGRHLLTVSLGTRRYLSKEQIKDGKCFMRSGHACSVLVSVQHPYETRTDRSFSQLKIEKRKRSGASSSFTTWETALDGLYWDVLHGEAFDSDALLVSPKTFFEGNGELTAYVVNNNLFIGNSVKAGIGLPEKNALYNMVKSYLAAFGAKELPLIPDISSRSMNDSLFPMVASKDETLTIEVYSSKEMFEKIRNVLSAPQKSIDDTVVLDEISDSLYKLHCDKDVIVELVHCNPEGIVAELEIDQYKEKSMAKNKRINQIIKQLTHSKRQDHSVVTLVEIDEKDKWREDCDPKKAIREGMIKAGRLTQFIYPLTDDETGDVSRILNAALDLFHDYGLLSHNINKINHPGTLLSVMVLKAGNKHLPAISRLTGTELRIKLFGIDSWLSLQEAALRMNETKFLDSPNKNNRSSKIFEVFITTEIQNELDRCEGQLIVLVNATLRNGWLRAIGNTKIQWDRIPVLNERLSHEPRLKFIRINATDDVPQYRIIVNDAWDEVNKASGIFKDPMGAYYGVGGRPSAWKGISNAATKFSSPSKQLLQQKAVEYIPLGAKDDDELDELAVLADHLRRVGLTYDKHTILPYTMRVLNSLSKYITGHEDRYDYVADFDDEVLVDVEEDLIEVDL
ncbi:hypothetical protein E6C60_0865 [Paenibacillus algicola]|uniref:DUF3893 domain-containing protein n=1 Tax=Paenibacillus algicola TaxID=2565926 RepID=A0A4P8XGJ6_9BACL|nr:DUF3962 domain-containing protein [Paenibacillus algicola]QCT01586.1 hypothetical protein E6C60_0865 [Paenibacillus algicola]